MIKPKKLRPGDKIATVSLSWGGPGERPHRYEAGKQQLQNEFKLSVVEMPHTLRSADWLRRNPEARAADMMAAFSDPTIKGIISTIGGDDSIRTLPYIDLDVIKANPKVFMGYSDTTISHLACYKAGLVTFYGPSIMSGFAENGGMFPYMIDAVRRSLFSAEPIGHVRPNDQGWVVEQHDWAVPANQQKRREPQPSTGWRFIQGKGVWQGHLIGGCLEVLDWLRGNDYWPAADVWENGILFLETSEDAPSPDVVKYTLRAFAAIGALDKLSGILLGRPGGPVPPETFEEYDRVLLDVVSEEAGRPDLPIITGMDFGHTDPMCVLPYGVQAKIDCDKQRFEIVENAVVD